MPKRISSRCLNVLPGLALTLLFGWAAWERFRVPLTPFADPDISVYLRPGLNALLGEQFRDWFGQCFLYPWFLYALLRITDNFKWITLVQSLLGLGTGALLFASWMEMRRLLPTPRLPLWAFKLLGAGLAGVYLLSTATIQFERTLRPEAVFPFVVILQIYSILRFIRACFLDHEPGRLILSGASAVFLSVAASLLKPSFCGALPLANLPVIISLFRPGKRVWGKVFLVGIPVTAVAFLLVWPESTLRRRDPAASSYLWQSLFSVHADLISKQIAEDVARHIATRYPLEFLAATDAALIEALRDSRGENGKYWSALGFNGDYFKFGGPAKPSFLSDLTRRLGSENRSRDFCRYYYWRTVRGQPAGMAAKIARQFAVFYSPWRCPAYITYASFSLAEQYQQTGMSLRNQPNLQRYAPGASLLASVAALIDSPLWIGPYRVIPRINLFMARTHLYWCLWAGSLAVLAWTKPNLSAFRACALVLVLLYGYNFGTVATLAIGHSLDVDRYSQYQFAYTVLPDFVSMWLAIEVFVLAANHWKQRRIKVSQRHSELAIGRPLQ
jgi:hypothetical protein